MKLGARKWRVEKTMKRLPLSRRLWNRLCDAALKNMSNCDAILAGHLSIVSRIRLNERFPSPLHNETINSRTRRQASLTYPTSSSIDEK
jgi:hypothetical protein